LLTEQIISTRNLLTEPVPDYIQAVVDTCVKIHTMESDGDILAFLTGMEEVDRAVSLLSEYDTAAAADRNTKCM
jgi:ATP-dependent RNA helicase DDX35